MTRLLVAHALLFVVTALVCLAGIPRARKIQHAGTREGLLGLLVSVTIWAGGYVGYLFAPTIEWKLGFYILGSVFAFVAVGAWLYFCAAYTGRPPRNAPYRTTAVGAFLALAALKITNPLHELYFTATWATNPFPHLAITHQPLYWISLGITYVISGIGFFMLFEQFHHTGADTRPLLGLAGLTAIPAVVTVFSDELHDVLPLMYEPPGVALFAIGTLFVYNQRFEAIRSTADTDSPAIFLDRDDHILDYNEAAQAIFPALDGSIGSHIDAVRPALAGALPEQDVITVTENGTERAYEVSHTPFMAGEMETGKLVTITDVTERESYRQQLEAKTEQLETLNRVVRHDIRNDMAVVQGWADSLENHIDPAGEDALERVINKSDHVIELTDILADVVESVAGTGETAVEPTELARILETELAAVRESHSTAEIRVSGPIPAVSVQANEMLSSVFGNILENAVRHSDENPAAVEISCTEQAETVRVRFADTGPGVPDNQKEEIFGKGEKGLESPGSGIGLYLVHTLVEQFGGEVWVEDNDPKGAVFIVELRKAN
ncbi:GHKL domain-containing protein [Halonotius sp. F2-221B]|uniref:ATP-binding protein n=1 Tax=Halonotius sp. F2-221B TaxID=2731620 RepID=UPI00398A6F22